MNKSFVVLIGVALLECNASFCAQAEELPKSSPTALQAGVELTVRLPAIDPSLTPGNKFDLDAATNLLKKDFSLNRWYKVPAWAAGRWREDKAVTTYYRDEKTGVESEVPHPYKYYSSFNIGLEDDKSQQIWGFADANYWTTTETENRYCHSFVTSLQPLMQSDEKCSFRGLSVTFIVDKMTNRIISCKQRETVQVYESVPASKSKAHSNAKSKSKIRNYSCHRVFNWDGTAELSATNESDCYRTSKYENHGHEKAADGRVLHPMFVDYLRTHDMSALIP